MDFIRHNLLSAIGFFLSPLVVVGDLIVSALHLYEMGIPAGIWAAIGVVIFALSVIGVLYRQHLDIRELMALRGTALPAELPEVVASSALIRPGRITPIPRVYWIATIIMGAIIAAATWLSVARAPEKTAGTTANAAPSPSPPKAAFVNPIHDDAVKWKLARDLRILSSKINGKCDTIIVRYQGPYSEHYADDLIEVLKTVGWGIKQHFASDQLPNDLSLRTTESGISRECADALKQRLDNTAEGRTGSLHTSLTVVSARTPYMNTCSSECTEIDIGNDPQL
jgi:hypothetical protein